MARSAIFFLLFLVTNASLVLLYPFTLSRFILVASIYAVGTVVMLYLLFHPRNQWLVANRSRVDGTGCVALTFDDGPGPYTPEVLSILEQQNVPATFFEVGVLEQYFHASTSEIVTRRYAVGDHTFSHAPMSRLSRADQRAQLLQDALLLQRYGAAFPRLFRPPYGLWNSVTLALLHKYRMLMVLWTVDTSDYRRPGTAEIVKSAVAGAKPGAIILMHDAGGNRAETAAALPKVISQLRARGYRFVTVPRLLLDNPPPHNQQFSSLIGSGG
jgi:peptidoglycan/xylan/chitin deacetylase (PgdA/CDA1 family)